MFASLFKQENEPFHPKNHGFYWTDTHCCWYKPFTGKRDITIKEEIENGKIIYILLIDGEVMFRGKWGTNKQANEILKSFDI